MAPGFPVERGWARSSSWPFGARNPSPALGTSGGKGRGQRAPVDSGAQGPWHLGSWGWGPGRSWPGALGPFVGWGREGEVVAPPPPPRLWGFPSGFPGLPRAAGVGGVCGEGPEGGVWALTLQLHWVWRAGPCMLQEGPLRSAPLRPEAPCGHLLLSAPPCAMTEDVPRPRTALLGARWAAAVYMLVRGAPAVPAVLCFAPQRQPRPPPWASGAPPVQTPPPEL